MHSLIKKALLAGGFVSMLACQPPPKVPSLGKGGRSPSTANTSQGAKLTTGGYFVEWGVYGRKFEVDDVPFEKLDYLVYAFIPICGPAEYLKSINPKSWETLQAECKGKQPFEVTIHDTFAALSPPHDNFKKIAAKKAANPKIKILPSIGGWSLSDDFHAMAATTQTRSVFIKSAVAFLEKYPFFDGIDIDWEYPGGGGASTKVGTPADTANHIALFKELRDALDEYGKSKGGKHYLITSAVGAGPKQISNTDYKAIYADKNRPLIDLIFGMTYDYYGSWNGLRGHQSAVYEGVPLAEGFYGQATIDSLIKAGVPPKHIMYGVAAYGRGWQDVTGGPLSTSSTDMSGTALALETGMWEPGIADYKWIVEKVKTNPAYKYVWDEKAQSPYYWSESLKKVITFDDPCSVQVKMDFARSRGLAGTFSWELDGDNGDLLNVMAGSAPSGCPTSKPIPPAPGPGPTPPTPTPGQGPGPGADGGDPAKGKAIVTEICSFCHSPGGPGAKITLNAVIIPLLDETQKDPLKSLHATFADKFQGQNRKDLEAYLKTLPAGGASTPAPSPAPAPTPVPAQGGNVEKGKTTVTTLCVGCHVQGGPASKITLNAAIIPLLDETQKDPLKALHGTFADRFQGENRKDLEAYLKTLPAGGGAMTPAPAPAPSPTPAQSPSTLGDCPNGPAINQISKWWATTEGSMVPSSGTLVKKEDGKSIARVTWNGNEWHVVPVWIGNEFEFSTNLQKSKSLTLSYQSPGDFYLQLRTAPRWSGAAHWGVKVPKSADKIATVTIPLEAAKWGPIPGLDQPSTTFAEALSAVRGIVIVGKEPGGYLFTSMLIDGFTPPCK